MPAAKAELRRSVLALRDAITPEANARFSDIITAALIELPKYVSAKQVLAYMSFGSEFNTQRFVRRVIDDGKTLALPKINYQSRSLDLYRVSNLDTDLEAGVWGIREPSSSRCPSADAKTIDFVLVPGVAFDRSCNRLGYGAGFYDRLLASLAGQPSRVAAAFSAQIVETLPTDEHDIAVDVVITETGRLERAAS